MNVVWLFLIISGSIVAIITGNLDVMITSVLEGAQDAVQLAISFAGIFCLWVGIEKLANESGVIDMLAKISRPILGPLFPHVKDERQVMGAISATIISNVLGLSSQTPLGLKAMSEIKQVYGESTQGIESMTTLVVISAAGFCIFPSGVIALRAALGSHNPAIVTGPTAIAGLIATCAGLTAHKIFLMKHRYRRGGPK